MCGEKASGLLANGKAIGSPPRVWGKEILVLQVRKKKNGITPTCVGKSNECPLALYTRKDHPHVCGEKLVRKYRCAVL